MLMTDRAGRTVPRVDSTVDRAPLVVLEEVPDIAESFRLCDRGEEGCPIPTPPPRDPEGLILAGADADHALGGGGDDTPARSPP